MAARSNVVLESIELGDNLKHALASVRHMRGGEALALGAGLLGAALGMLPLLWHFDIQPTIQWIGTAAPGLTSTLPGELALVAPIAGIMVYLLPTLFEVTLSRLASAGFRFAEVLVYFAVVFDAVTDWPNVAQTMDAAWPRFADLPVGILIWWISRLLLLAMATLGFELVFTICLVCGATLIVNGFRKAGGP